MIPLIETGGTAYEIGHDVGAQARDQIRESVHSTRAEFARDPAPEVTGAIGSYLSATKAHAPEVIEELQGMAAGAGVSLEELFVVNASAELHQAAGRFSECTVAGITQSGTVDGHVLLSHNEDATAGWDQLAYVISAQPTGRPSFVAFTYAGLLLHQGLNSAGIASVGNALYARDARPGIPKLLQYRRILGATSLEQAIRIATDPQRGFGNNHLIANAEGDIVDLEVTGSDWAMTFAGNRYLVHANHLVSPRMTHLDCGEDLLNSRLRHARLERLIEADWGKHSAATLRATMADHSNFPRSLCKHSAPESDLDYGTIGSVVIDLTARTLWACAGNPCRSARRQVTLPSP